MRQIIDAVSEYERAIIGARTKAALRAKLARGERTGAVPFGYRLAADGVQLELNDVEQNVCAAIEQWPSEYSLHLRGCIAAARLLSGGQSTLPSRCG